MEFLNELSKIIVQGLSSLGVWYDILVNFFGVIAIILLVMSFQMKSRIKLLLVFILSQSTWIIYFVLQGDLASGIMCTIAIIMSLIFMQREKHKWANSIFWLFFFVAILRFLPAVLCQHGSFSVIIVSGSFQNGIPVFCQDPADIIPLAHAEFKAQVAAGF